MTTNHFKLNLAKGGFYLAMTIVLLIHSLVSGAQSFDKANVFYRGFDVSFGVRTTTMQSKISEINNLRLVTEGGSLGFVYGTEVLKGRINAGYFYSAASVPQTIDQVHISKSVNFYPLAMAKNKISVIEPYLIGGVNYDVFKFAGSYLEGAKPTTSSVNDEYIGKTSQLNGNIGGGIAFRVLDNINFLHLYTQVQRSFRLNSESNNEAFKGTYAGGQLIITAGVRFGIVK
jgi:hypothetical protein